MKNSKLQQNLKLERGYTALISIIIVSALMVLLLSSSLSSINEFNTSFKEKKSWEAFYLATACAEEALVKLKDSLDYVGGETLEFDNETCQVLIVRGGGNRNRTIETLSSVDRHTRRITVSVGEVNPRMIIQHWQEVSDFTTF